MLNGYYEILNLLLDLYIEQDINVKVYSKMDQIKDHVIKYKNKINIYFFKI